MKSSQTLAACIRCCGLALGLTLGLVPPAPAAAPAFTGERLLELKIDSLPEISGLAPSRRHADLFWAVNDSGNAPLLQAFDRAGQRQAAVRVRGGDGLDWEDLAAYTRDGQPWLAIADIGDNFALRGELEILLLPEPALGATELIPARRLRFEYEDGARDAEAIAVDPVAGQILILEKRRPPAGLYALSLDGPDHQIARRIAVLPERWPEAPVPVQNLSDARMRGAVTSMDLSPDGRTLAVLSYSHFALLRRAAGEDWATALQRPPIRVSRVPRRTPGLEAIAWDPGGVALWLMPEGLPSPLFRWGLPAAGTPSGALPVGRPAE